MLPQFKAAGLAVVFDLTAHTFYRVSLCFSVYGMCRDVASAGIYKAKVRFFTKAHHLHNQNSSIYVLVVCCPNYNIQTYEK